MCVLLQGIWELSINKPHHAELELRHLRPVVQHLQSANVEVSRLCAAAMWGLAVNEQSRVLQLQLGAVEVLLSVARHSLTMQCVGDQSMLPADYVAGGKCSQTQRNQLQVCTVVQGDESFGSCCCSLAAPLQTLRYRPVGMYPCSRAACYCCVTLVPGVSQACVLGALSVLIVDKACRQPLIAAEPACSTLFELSSNLEGCEDHAWVAARREAAAKAITSLLQRDHEARKELMLMGGINSILSLLDAKVSNCMRSGCHEVP